MCTYNFELPVDPIPLLVTLARVIEEHGGVVSGALPDVSVTLPTSVGPVEGQCRLVQGTLINIQITRKPEFITCTMVRDKLVSFLSEAVKAQAQTTVTVESP